MTRVLLIAAAPTPWDAEGRLGGNPMLPLTTDGEIALRDRLAAMSGPPPEALYAFRGNAACEQAARLVARQFDLRIHDAPLLEPVSMGLWQGLTRDELRFRFPSIFPEWEENPLGVNPPQGEALADAAGRLREGTRKVLRKCRGGAVAIVLRPMSLQIVAGLLRGEDLPAIVTHLHRISPAENIDAPDDALREPGD